MPYKNPHSEHAKRMARERHQRWREKNRDVLRERSAQFHRDNPDYLPTYHQENAEKAREYKRANRERENALRRERYRRRHEARDADRL